MKNAIVLSEKVKKLSVDLNVGKLQIINSDDGQFSYQIENADEENFEIINTETEISIIDKTKIGNIFGRWFQKGKINNNAPKVTVLIPKNHKLETVKIKVAVCKSKIQNISSNIFRLISDVGYVKLKNITADDFKINADVGSITGKNIITKKTTINAGIGPCDFMKSEFSDVKLNCGIGSFTFAGKLNGNSVVSAGIGAINLKLNAPRNDYNLHVSTGVGRIKINDDIIDGFSTKKEYDNNSYNTIKINGGIGKLEIKFLE